MSMRGSWIPSFLAFCSAALAQSGIGGVVQDPSKATVPGATVLLRANSNGRELETNTDANGSFRFDSVDPGDYQLEVRQSGFRPAVSRVNVGTRPPGLLRIV